MGKIKGWKKIHEGMESPSWYNIIYENIYGNQLVLSNISREYEGTSHPNSMWGVGASNGVLEGDTKSFRNKEQALKFAINYMRRHPNG